ncbi:MAG: sigma-54 interaction domain-containing protein [Thermodesulfobacteriota bacterium]
MGKNGTIRILVVGHAKKLRVFLGAVSKIPATRLTGILDPSPCPEGLGHAKRHGVPVYLAQRDVADWNAFDTVLVADDRAAAGVFDPSLLPSGLEVVRGMPARLMRRLAGAFARQRLETGKYKGMKRVRSERSKGIDDLIGKSAHLMEVKELIRMVGPTPTPVLLLGETGTGKDMAARAIHGASLVKDQPFVAVNCTALTGTLMESELFGYKKGAFTGADEDRPGLMEEADGGTLFLDEVGDMPLDLQAKLLRFLQTGEVRRVGSTKTRTVDVRVVAATNRDMAAGVESGQFRSDLFYRFNTFTITLRPLRDRPEDIAFLAYHFLTKAEAKLNKKIDEISSEAMAAMSAYSWPGNIRELANVIERGVILCRDGVLGLRELPQQIYEAGIRQPGTIPAPESPRADQPDPAAQSRDGFAGSRERIMSNFERTELQLYLKKAGGNVSEACRLSGIPRRTFYRKMQKYGL